MGLDRSRQYDRNLVRYREFHAYHLRGAGRPQFRGWNAPRARFAKTPAERRQVVAAIGPGPGTKFGWSDSAARYSPFFPACWPRLLRAITWPFLILWCLILRGISIEFGGHINDRLWQGFWDFVFVVSSLLLAVLFGAAGGNLARGVPLDDHGNFAMAFFTDFGTSGYVGLLDWYTLSVAIFAVVMLAAHGATYLTLKTEGPVHDRSASYAMMLWLILCPLGMIVSVETWYVRPDVLGHAIKNPFSWLGLISVATSAVTLFSGLRKGLEFRALIGSTFLIAGLLGTGGPCHFSGDAPFDAGPGQFRNGLRRRLQSRHPSGGAVWWPVAFILAASYFVFISRRYAGKVSTYRDNQGYY